ncbi:MAG: DUF6171 family protein [Planctomycetales bacterium]
MWNFAEALAAFASLQDPELTVEQYEERLTVCDGCEHRQVVACRLCGCNLPYVARSKTSQCPAGLWSGIQPT